MAEVGYSKPIATQVLNALVDEGKAEKAATAEATGRGRPADLCKID